MSDLRSVGFQLLDLALADRQLVLVTAARSLAERMAACERDFRQLRMGLL